MQNSDHLVKHLPQHEVSDGIIQYAGHIQIDHIFSDNKIFYWMVLSKNNWKIDPVIFWFNGGIGFSSMVGLFNENCPQDECPQDGGQQDEGPFLFDSNGSLQSNKHSWNANATIVYIDQPIGTGFSTVDGKSQYRSNIFEITADFNIFIQKFYRIYPELLKNNLYLTGKYYAGIYIPYFANAIISETNYNLKGIIIGNGLIDPYIHATSYIEHVHSNGTIDANQKNHLKNLLLDRDEDTPKNIYTLNELNDYINPTKYTDATTSTNFNLPTNADRFRKLYNIILSCATHNSPKKCDSTDDTEFIARLNSSTIKLYLNQRDVQMAIHIKDQIKWEKNNDRVRDFFINNECISTQKMISYILSSNRGIKCVFYNEQHDCACNNIDNLMAIKSLDYKNFNINPQHAWGISEKTPVGYIKASDDNKLVYICINNCSDPSVIAEYRMKLLNDTLFGINTKL